MIKTTNSFYQEMVTQKSWQILQNLKKQVAFILIGGWAVFLYTNSLKSKDIDVIIDYGQLEDLKRTGNVYKNERLRKYEIKREGVDIDIYLPFFSRVGLPAEELVTYATSKETFSLLKKEILAVTKIAAYVARKASIKGRKDLIDIISLLLLDDFDYVFFKKILKKYNLHEYNEVVNVIFSKTKDIPELGLNRHFFAKRKKEIVSRLTNRGT